MEQYLYRIEPSRPAMLTEGLTDHESAVVREHFDYLLAKAREGTLFMAGRTATQNGRSFGLAVFRAESPEAAEEFLRNDPAVREGVMTGVVFPFRVAIWSGNPLSAADPT